MSYQVIARKYRPQRFSDVVGQEHVTRTLTHAIEQKRIAHAYLFCGPRGTGKTTIARIFAKCLNCTNGPSAEFSDDDPRCQEITDGRSLDVLEIDAASNRGIDEIRGLRDTVRYAPATSRFKVYIIDEVHMLTKEAFNALLKTLEEPPEHVKFMFATTEPEKVLPTILSRCQRFDLRRIPAALIVKHLAGIAKSEKVKIDPAALYAIARGAEGAMRDAESTLDQLISFCGDSIEESDVLSMFGLAAQGQVLDLAGAMLTGEVQVSLRQLNELANNGKDLTRLLSDLLNHFRNLLIYQVSRGDPTMLEVSEAEAAALGKQAVLATSDGLTRILEVLGDAESRLRDAASKKILIEVALLKAIESRQSVNLDVVLKQLQALRTSPSFPGAPPGSGATNPEPTATPQPVPLQPKPQATGETSELREEVTDDAGNATRSPGLNQLWGQLVESVGRVSPFTRTYLLEAHAVSFNGNLLTIGFDPENEQHIGLVDNARNHTLLRTKLEELGHSCVQFKFIRHERPPASATIPPVQEPAEPAPPKAPTAAPRPTRAALPPGPSGTAPTSVPFNKDEFKQDPLIQRALEVFKAQIVEVRVNP
jgi:DNA polymerase-3 subunit gamma/tau